MNKRKQTLDRSGEDPQFFNYAFGKLSASVKSSSLIE